MPRSLIRYLVVINDPATGKPISVAGASGTIYRTGTTTPPVMYLKRYGGTPLTNPLIADARGEIIAWLDAAENPTVDIHIDNSYGGAARRAAMPARLTITPFMETITADMAAAGGVGGGGGSTPAAPGAVPTVINAAASYTVAENTQALFALPIVVDGNLIVDGQLVEV